MQFENNKSFILLLSTEEWKDITDAFGTIGGCEDVIDAGDDLVDVIQVATVVASG